MITAPGCGACRRLHQLLDALAADGALPPVALLRVDAERAGGLLEELAVFHLPALVPVAGGGLGAPLAVPLARAPLLAALAALAAAPREPPAPGLR